MANRQFALPLDENSQQTGEITLKTLAANCVEVRFRVTNVRALSMRAKLNLITKGGSQNDHIFSAPITSGEASVNLSAGEVNAIWNDANGGAWDYVEACWTVDEADTPAASSMAMVQSGHTYDLVGWPPK
jgi:hypothetical protein